MNDKAMQLVVEIAVMNPIEYRQGDECCYFCGEEAKLNRGSTSPVTLDHVPFCAWLQCRKLAEPWLTEEQRKPYIGMILHREAA